MYRKFLLLFIGIAITGLIFMSCSDDGSTAPTPPAQKVKIISPNGGEILQMGQTVWVKFDNDLTDPVDIFVYNGQDSIDFVDVNISLKDSVAWLIPTTYTQGFDYKLKITSSTDPTKYDFSDAEFTIAPAGNYVMVISPNGGEIWLKGSPKTVNWITNIAGTVRIDLYKNYSPEAVIYNSTANDGTQGWTIPGTLDDGADYQILVQSIETPSVFDYSDNFFCLASNVAAQNIIGDWTVSFSKQPSYFYFNTNGTVTTDGTESGTWKMTGNGIRIDDDGSSSYLIGIVEGNEMEGTMVNYDGSTGLWEADRVIPELLTPNGGQVWMRGTTQTITWDTAIAGNVVLSLADSTGVVRNIATVLGSLGTYEWAIPTNVVPGAAYLIRIHKEINAEAMDESDAYICISENLTIDVVGDWVWNFYWSKNTTSLTFAANGTCSNGYGETGTWTSSGNGINFNWGGSWYFMGLVNGDKMDGTQYQPPSSTGVWDAHRILQVLTPNVGGFYEVGDEITITWYETLTAENVTIDLYENDVLYRNLGTVNVNNFTSFKWTVPSNVVTSTKYKIRMTSTTSDIYDESDNYFTIDAVPATPAIIDEGFEDGTADGWTGLDGTWTVADGVYSVSSGTLTQSSSISSFDVTGNYVFEARMKKTAGESYYYGLIFNGGDTTLSATNGWWQNSSMFVIRTDGYYGMWTYDDGAWPVSTGYQYSAAVNTGLDVWNTLKIIVNDDTGDHHLFVNDQYLQTINSTYYSGGKLGLAVYDSGLVGTGAVDWVKVSPVNKSEIEKIIVNRDISKGKPVNR
jgi:hypothetical protein